MNSRIEFTLFLFGVYTSLSFAQDFSKYNLSGPTPIVESIDVYSSSNIKKIHSSEARKEKLNITKDSNLDSFDSKSLGRSIQFQFASFPSRFEMRPNIIFPKVRDVAQDHKIANKAINDMTQIVERKLSSTVRNSIDRVLNGQNVKQEASQITQKKNPIGRPIEIPALSGKIINDLINNPRQTLGEDKDSIEASDSYKISAISLNLDNHSQAPLRDFEVSFAYAPDNIERSYNSDFIFVKNNLNSGFGAIRIEIQAKDHIPTTTTLALGDIENSQFLIPVFNSFALMKFFDVHKFYHTDGALLLALEDSEQEIEIDSLYKTKLYFDEQLNITETQKKYIFYSGLTPGPRTIQILDKSNNIATYVVVIEYDKIHFERVSLLQKNEKTLILDEMPVVGKSGIPYDIDPKNITYYNTKVHASKIGVNKYSFFLPIRSYAMREYFRIQDRFGEFYIGTAPDKLRVLIPSEYLVNEVYKSYSIEGINRNCLILFNLSESIDNVEASFKGEFVSEPEIKFIDKDGLIENEPSQYTIGMSILGSGHGTVELKLNYLNQTADYLNSFCTPNVMIVEQL